MLWLYIAATACAFNILALKFLLDLKVKVTIQVKDKIQPSLRLHLSAAGPASTFNDAQTLRYISTFFTPTV